MNVWEVKVGDVLDCLSEGGIVRLCQYMVNQALLGEGVHDPRNEISGEAVWSRIVDFECRVCERTIQDASTTCSSSEIENIY